MDLTYKIVRRLLRDDDVKFSRNRNFEAFEDARVKRAVRIYRHLRSLERDLLALHDTSGAVRLEAVDCEGDQMTVRLTFAERRGLRVSYLTRREWLLLLENERVSDILRQLMAVAGEDTQRVLRESLAIA
ncbi:MAG: hypothetical protein H0U74_08490 [Bradymonadaceae bacterium]|nr:hypothetical protein [Lujinxingiaceae bacterium]